MLNNFNPDRKVAMDNRDTLHEIIHQHLMCLDEFKRNNQYSEWYNEIKNLFRTIHPKIVNFKNEGNEEMEFEGFEIVGKKNKKKKNQHWLNKIVTIKAGKKIISYANYKTCFDYHVKKFRRKMNHYGLWGTFGKLNKGTAQGKTIIEEGLAELEIWVRFVMEKHGIFGRSPQMPDFMGE